MMNRRGFTLLEVIIATTILAFISLFTARMIQQGIKARAKIQSEIDSRSGLNAALQLMVTDIAKAFNYRDINVELYNAAQKQRLDKKFAPKPPPAGAPPPLVPAPSATPPPLSPEEEAEYRQRPERIYTRFYGETDKLDFTTLDAHRSTQDAHLSDQVEVGYYLDSCSSRIKRDQSSTCLWRRFSTYIDDDIKEGGRELVVLENVKSLKFRYLGPGHEEEWTDTWMSENGEEVMKNKFPYAVEITLVVNDLRFSPAKEIGMTVVAPIEFPNNKPDAKSNVVN